MTSGYWDLRDLRERFRCSGRSIFRWMSRSQNAFPQPSIRRYGSRNLWKISEVIAWETQEATRASSLRVA